MAPTPESIESLKHAPGVAGMVKPILNRWSPRAFADREVSMEDLKKGFEAARWAASSSNEQPWRFVVGRRGDETFKKILDALVPGNQVWAKNAPVLILSVARKHFAHNGRVKDTRKYTDNDTRLAALDMAFRLKGSFAPVKSQQESRAVSVLVVDLPRPIHTPDDDEIVTVSENE